MKILHVVNIYFVLPYFIGGQFSYFRKKGYRMFVACSKSEYLHSYAERHGFNFIETPVNRSFTLGDDIKSIRAICRYIRQQNIDVVVGHTPKGGLLAMIAGWICRVPIRIYFRHGLVYETSHGIKRFILMTVDRVTSFCATKIVCVSQSVLYRSIEDRLAPARKQMILHKGTCNGVDALGQFNPDNIDKTDVDELRNRYGIKSTDFVIGYSGRLVKDKGIIDLINAFDCLEDSCNYKLLLVGMFEDRDSLPEDIKYRILHDERIIYTGFINGSMENYYSLMNVYVLPSYREGFPTGVLEAQSMRIPVITTKVTGCCDSIIDGLTGLFTDHTPQSIANKIKMIHSDKYIDGEDCRKWVMENFNSNLIWAEIDKLYN